MFSQLERALNINHFEYLTLRNNCYEKVGLYFVLGNQEIVVLKKDEEKIKHFIKVIEEW